MFAFSDVRELSGCGGGEYKGMGMGEMAMEALS